MEKSDAVMLRIVEFSNTSCIVTAFTRDFGKISALAKGAWRRHSPFESALDVLAICQIVFVHKTGDVLDLLTEAKLERRYRAAARELTRFYAGCHLADLVLSMTEAADPQPELYELLSSALIGLDDGEPVDAWVLRFELRTLAILGHGMALDHCTVCGQRMTPGPKQWFGLSTGGLLCGRCRPGKRQVVHLSARDIDVLRRYSRPDANWRESANLNESLGPVRGLMNQYLTYLLARRPKLLGYLYPRSG